MRSTVRILAMFSTGTGAAEAAESGWVSGGIGTSNTLSVRELATVHA
ncbi:Uncharacterised protein [Mycobacteroides abscessus subsp. abscessus]|nr:Uncharacterised protein [Mycobacteroides abscessus subsp. abscessus]